MSEDLILALDIGTSGIRGALFDFFGQKIPSSEARIERKPKAEAPNASEFDARAVVRETAEILDAVIRKAPRGIAFIATSSLWHTLVGIDANHNPTTPVYTWADNRSRDQVQQLRNHLDEREIHNRVGTRFHQSFWPAKLLWLRNQSGGVWRQTAKWLSLPDFLTLSFCGHAATSISIASGTGIFNVRSIGWDDRLTEFLGLKSNQLAEIARDGEGFSFLQKFRRRWPQLRNAKWLPAIGDGAAANIGSACTRRPRAALTIGTSAALRVSYRGKPPDLIPDGLFCYRADSRRIVLGGALSDGGGLIDYLKTIFAIGDDLKMLDRKIRTRRTSGIAFLPFVNGERSTGYNPYASGVIYGLKPQTDPIDIIKAAIEGIGFRLAAILDEIESISRVREIVGSGGAFCSSRALQQTVADIFGRKIHLSPDCEASLRGAALHAAETTGKIDRIETVEKTPRSSINFDPVRRRFYADERKRHEAIYKLFSFIESNEYREKTTSKKRS